MLTRLLIGYGTAPRIYAGVGTEESLPQLIELAVSNYTRSFSFEVSVLALILFCANSLFLDRAHVRYPFAIAGACVALFVSVAMTTNSVLRSEYRSKHIDSVATWE